MDNRAKSQIEHNQAMEDCRYREIRERKRVEQQASERELKLQHEVELERLRIE